jgi:hypothetical protein
VDAGSGGRHDEESAIGGLDRCDSEGARREAVSGGTAAPLPLSSILHVEFEGGARDFGWRRREVLEVTRDQLDLNGAIIHLTPRCARAGEDRSGVADRSAVAACPSSIRAARRR